MIETVWAFQGADALNVEAVSEVKRDSETKFNSNDVLTSQGLRFHVGVSWAEQMSLWFIEYTTNAGYWEMIKRRYH